jgi:hypothetical protein
MEAVDEAVIRAAVTLVNKWRAFQEGDINEEPANYSVPALALEKAVDARQKALDATTSKPSNTIREDHYGVEYTEEKSVGDQLKPTPAPSITVGTQVRLTGVVVQVEKGYLDIHLDGDGGGVTCITPEAAKYAEVIRQPFKRGEVVWHAADDEGKADGATYVVVKLTGTSMWLIAELWKVLGRNWQSSTSAAYDHSQDQRHHDKSGLASRSIQAAGKGQGNARTSPRVQEVGC